MLLHVLSGHGVFMFFLLFNQPIETQSLFQGKPGQEDSNIQYITELKHTFQQHDPA